MFFASVDYVEIQEEKIPVAFNMRALHLGEKETKKSINEVFAVMQNGDLGAAFELIPFFWFAVCEGYKIINKDVPFEREDMESMDFGTLGKFTEAFSNAVAKMDDSEKKQLKTVKKGTKAKA